jgi:hypothetical protein
MLIASQRGIGNDEAASRYWYRNDAETLVEFLRKSDISRIIFGQLIY